MSKFSSTFGPINKKIEKEGSFERCHSSENRPYDLLHVLMRRSLVSLP
jgi:hypothetical protein